MEYKKDLFDTDIPEFAMQPAKPAEDIDTSVYDRLYSNMADGTEKKDNEQPALDSGQDQGAVLVSAPVEEATVLQPEPESIIAEQQTEPVEAQPTIALAEVAVEKQEEETEVETEIIAEEESEPVMAQPITETPEQLVAEQDEEVGEEAEETVEPISIKEEHKQIVAATPVSLPKAAVPVKIIPAAKNQISRTINYTDFRELSPVVIHVEEDILVPDTKPDMEQIICVEGRCRLSERNVHTGSSGTQILRVSGDVSVQAVYLTEEEEEYKAVLLETRLPFRDDCSVNAAPNGYLAMYVNLDKLEHEKINDRKYRIKADVCVNFREYRGKELNLFSGIEGEKVESLKGKLNLTDVALRRTETVEISEDLQLKEGASEIEEILCYNINISENHKQISREKAVINALVYCNILYQSDKGPELYQGKTEFTQFMKMEDEGAFSQPLTGNRITFQVNNLSIKPKEDVKGDCNLFGLDMDVETTIECYRQLEEPVITDLYHYEKNVRFDTELAECMHLYGNGSTETTVREIVNIPEHYGSGSRIVYISGTPVIRNKHTDSGKCIVEGVIPVRLICLAGDDRKATPFSVDQDLEFRAALDIPGCGSGLDADCVANLKELWFDQINSRQIEINAIAVISANVFGKINQNLIQNVSFIEPAESEGQKPAMIVYISKDGDNVWKIAKKYQTCMDQIREINGLGDKDEINRGTKLLIIR